MTEAEWQDKCDWTGIEYYRNTAGDVRSFTDGIEWCRKNPPPEVLGLLETLNVLYRFVDSDAYFCEEACEVIKKAFDAFDEKVK